MQLVATLISAAQPAALRDDLLREAAIVLRAEHVDRLAEGIAADLFLPDSMDGREAETSLRRLIAGQPVDIAIQPLPSRRKKALIADMDSTMIRQECIDELADKAGLKDKVAAITARAMNGEIEFEPALRERVALLEGLPVEVIADVIASRITLMPGGRELVATMRAHGAWSALVSGGFTAFTGPVAAMLGFDEHRANTLEISDGRLAGMVREPILGKQAKIDALLDIAARRQLDPSDFIAVGDGANDLGMLQLAGAGVALHAKPAVAAQARIRVDHGDLTALLYLQGYRYAEFVR